ncbi:MAG TPA: CYTH domain-containing protein, partial [Phycisphaerales bacterium]|nr:CYTH domain-containing protein [Phycisphaerales bacterium]
MGGPQETEFKFLLTESQYRALVKELGPPLRSRRLINRFFVPARPVDRRDWVLRLRLEGEKKELTLKIGREIEPGLFDSTEY